MFQRRLLPLALTCAALFTAAAQAAVPQHGHVVVVLEENHSYSQVIGSSNMPYLNSLASKYALATSYYANTHPSIGNYFWLTAGQVITNNDSSSSTVTADNLVRHMLTAGKTWKSYAESLPYTGYTGGDTGQYLRRHNPFSFFSDVVNSSNQKMNLVPFTQFATDLNSNALPDFSYIAPNKQDDAHNCPAGMSTCSDAQKLQAADAWLKSKIAPLLANSQFQQDGLLVIVFDEGAESDSSHGGGHIAAVVVGPKVKQGYKGSGFYQHQNLLRTISEALGISSYPGAAASAGDMGEFFGSSSTTDPNPTPTPTPTPTGSCAAAAAGVTICSPGTASGTSVHISAAAKSGTSAAITAMKVYVDGAAKYSASAAGIDTTLSMSTGTHKVTVSAWSSSGTVYKSTVNVAVSSTSSSSTDPSGSGGSTSACSAGATGVTICSPGTSSTSPVHVLAAAKSGTSAAIKSMKVYVDGSSKYSIAGSTLDTSLSMSGGIHRITVSAWNSSGTVYKSTVNVTVQ
jgi:hypothetical protein